MKTTWKKTVALAAVLSAAIALPAAAQDDGPWQFRLRGIVVVPDESAEIAEIGGDAEIDVSVVPELDITYFFTDRLSAELILATTPHDAMAIGTSLGDLDLGSVWLLPPTLTLQFHPVPGGVVQPYVGAGGNLTFFYNVDVDGADVTAADYDTAFGFAIQAGFDIPLGDGGWLLNVDGKKVFLETDATFNDGGVTADVTIDPWIIGAGIGLRVGG